MVISSWGRLFCFKISVIDIFLLESENNDISPLEKPTPSGCKPENAEPSLEASVINLSFSAPQASYTAEPSDEVVADPPCVGPSGIFESPNSNTTLAGGKPMVFEASSVIEVAVPGPLSLTAHSMVKIPWSLNFAVTVALSR